MGETESKKRLAGKVAVVTGAGRGMGRAEAILLARQGARVVVNDLGCDVYGKGSDKTVSQAVVDEIRAEGGQAVANTGTVATMEGARSIIASAIDSFGRLDILINNAGILRGGAIVKMEEDDWDSMIATHLKGHYATIKHAAPVFMEQRSGVIVNTSSQAGLGSSQLVSYSAAKEGIVGLTRTIARELGVYGVRCNAVRPFAQTRMTNLTSIWESMRKSEKLLGTPALGGRKAPKFAGELSKPDQVAVMVVWLCTDAASNINGRIFQVGNGEIGLYSEPDIVRTSLGPNGWNLDMLDSPNTRSYLFGDLSNKFLPPQPPGRNNIRLCLNQAHLLRLLLQVLYDSNMVDGRRFQKAPG